jgi:hypothetical protein
MTGKDCTAFAARATKALRIPVLCAVTALGCGGAMVGGMSKYELTRLVISPSEHVEPGYGGYGYVAWSVGPTSVTRPLYVALCEELRAATYDDQSVGGNRSDRVVTIWPLADDLSTGERADCEKLAAHYDIRLGTRILQHLRLDGRTGPVLVAAPLPFTSQVRQEYLVLDLSGRSEDDVREGVRAWSEHVRMGPDQWESGWRIEQVRLRFRSTLTWLTDNSLFTSKRD